MRHQKIRVAAIAGLAFLFALDCLAASASAHTKTHPSRKRPYQVKPPPVRLIRCAALSYESPCWPDPGMLRLDRRPW